MKRLLIAIAAAAMTMFAPAAVTNQLGFEGAADGGTAYGSGVSAPETANYPFADFGAKYLELDDTYTAQAESGTVFDMYVQFTLMTEAPSFPTGAKIAVYADAKKKIHVLSGTDDYTTNGTVDTNEWARLTIVAESNGYKVYVESTSPIKGAVAEEDPISVFPAAAGADTNAPFVEFTGSGKLDNFVARTTNPFGGEPDNWIAKDEDASDPEQYYTDYTKALKAALAGATLTFNGETVMDGTSEHPFEIRTAADLVALQQAVATTPAARAYNYRQTANIDMSEAGAFAGIGEYDATPTAGKPFSGTYDGGNFKICNVDFTQRNYGGVFNQVNGGTIKNLTVSNITCSAFSKSVNKGEWGGAIVGNAGNGATLQNLVAEGTFAADHPATHNVAGIVIRACGGGENGTLIKDCTNNATLYGSYTKMAGICAIAQHKVDGGPVTFDGCSNTGTLTMPSGSTAGRDGLAGIIGYVSDDTVLKGCSNTGSMTSTLATAKVGQLVGWAYNSVLTFEDAGTIAANGPAKIGDFGSTVVLDWAISGNEGKNFDFNVYGKTGSTVELLQDFTGYPVIGSSIAPTLKLSANMTINDGNKNITNATFAVITGTGNLTMSNAQATRWYVITKLQNYSGVISAGSFEKVAFGDIVSEAGYGTALVKAGSNFNVDDLASTKVNGAAADLCVDTLNNQKGIYLAAAQVVADDASTTGYASVANALDAADAANASSVNVLDANAEVVEATDWSYENGVYTSTRAIATLKGTSYPSLAKALAAAQDGDTVTLVAATSEVVTIPANVTVAVDDGIAFNGTVAGAGTIVYTTTPSGTLAFGEWTGTVSLNYADIVSNADFAAVANARGIAGSWVEIGENGTASGYLNSALTPSLKVTGFMEFKNGSTSRQPEIPGLTGDGAVVFTYFYNNGGETTKYLVSNLVDWNGVITNDTSATHVTNIVSGAGTVVFKRATPAVTVGASFDGSIVYNVAPSAAPVVDANSECEVCLNFNYSNMNIANYGAEKSTIVLGGMTGHLANAMGLIASKVHVNGDISINDGWPLGSVSWTDAKVVKFSRLRVDGSLALSYTGDSWSGYAYYKAGVLDGDGAGAITVGNRFALRIDAVDFAEAPSGTNALVNLTLAGDTAGLLYGPNGVAGEQIPVTVNGVATEQTLVYDAAKSGLVLYVAPTPVAIDPSDVVINYNCYAELSVTGYPEGATFGWTMYTNGVACSSLSGPVQISTGKNKAKVKVYSVNSAFDGVVAKVAITNGEEVIEREATITVADVAARVGETEYTKAQLEEAAADAIANGKTLQLYTTGPKVTLEPGQTLVSQAVCDRNTPTPSVSAPTGTAELVYSVVKTIDNATKTYTYTLESDTPAVMFTAAADNSVEYLDASFKVSKAGTYKLLKSFSRGQLTVGNVAATLDLNGQTMTSTVSGSKGAIYVDTLLGSASLAIVDSAGGGKVVAESCYTIWANRNATVAIEAGEFTGSSDVVYLSNKASSVAISGGVFKMASGSAAYMLNMLDSARGTITVTGGKFYGFNPANNAAEGAGTNFVPNGYVSTETSTGVWTVSKSAGGFPGGEDGKTFTIDGEVTLPAGKALTDTASAATGLTYAQAAVLGLLDEEGALKEDVTPTIEVKNGKVVVSLDGTAVDATRYTVMLNVYEKASLTAEWPVEPTTRYELGSKTEAAGFEPSNAGAGFYKVGVTIEDAE